MTGLVKRHHYCIVYNRMIVGFQILPYQDQLYQVRAQVPVPKVSNPTSLKKQYGADLVLKRAGYYWILNLIIDAEFEDIT